MPPLNQFQKTVIALAVGHALLPSNLQAATITVDTANISTNAGDCDIYDAFYAANYNTAYAGCVAGDPGSDTIVLPNDVYITLNSSVNSNEVGLLVSSEVTLQGNGSRIRGSGEKRLIDVLAGGSLSMSNVYLRNGRLTSNDVGGGAAIRVTQGTLAITNSTLRSNSVLNTGGSIKHGAAIASYDSSVSLTRVLGNNNLTSSTITDSGPSGGFLRAEGSTITITESYLRNNSARQGFGGAISGSSNSQITVESSILQYNSARQNGGAIHNEDGNVSIVSSSFRGNRGATSSSTGAGGAIAVKRGSLSVAAQSNFSRNSTSFRGSAIWVYGDASTLTMSQSSVYRNSVTQNGGEETNSGAAIAIFSDSLSDYSTITNSTISENVGDLASIVISGGELGLFNSTVVAAAGGENSGGPGIPFRAKESFAGTALLAENNSIVNIANSVFANSKRVKPLSNSMPGSLCDISITATLNLNTNNHFADESCDGASDGDPLLSRRTSFTPENSTRLGVGNIFSGGEANRVIVVPTNYYAHVPQFNSSLIDAGDTTVCSSNPVGGEDIRSLPHDPSSACDIGAIDSREALILVDSVADGAPDALAACTLNDALLNAQLGANRIKYYGPGDGGLQESPRSGSTCEAAFDRTIIRFDPTVFPPSGNQEIQLQPGPFGELPRIDGVVSIQGPGQTALEIKGGGGARILTSKYATLDVSDLSLSGGQGSSKYGSQGGAIRANGSELTLNRVTVTKSSSVFQDGGAVALRSFTSARFTESTISESYTGRDGGGVHVGGESSLILNRSTITGNSAMGFTSSSGMGGGLYAGGESKLTMVNSTVSGNSARLGGGIFLESSDTDVLHGTITDNMSASRGAGVYIYDERDYGGATNFVSSILAGNKSMENLGNELAIQVYDNNPADPRLNITFEQSLFGSAESDYSQALISLNPSAAQVNIFPGSIVATSLDAGGGANPNSTAIAQILRPLSGSLLKVHELVSGSPAIDAGAIMGECRVATDQLGRARGGETCDMGATEILVNEDVFFIIRAANGNVITIPL